MKESLLDIVVCPTCKENLNLVEPQIEGKEVKSGKLICNQGHIWEIIDFIPRFVESDAYVKNFSFEWDIHRETQIDKEEDGISHKVFFRKTGFAQDSLRNKLVLDVGVGTGRFADIVEKAGGIVVGIDLSYAVNSAFKNLGMRQNAHIIQADVFKLPFRKQTFDYIYSIGVLHHTPNCKKAFQQLPELLKKEGEIAIWVYSAHNWSPGSLKETVNSFWRSITTRLPQKVLYALCHIVTPFYYLGKIFPWYSQIGHLVLPGFIYHAIPGTNKNKNLKIRILDTFDWYSPKYQSKHTYPEVFGWFKDSGLKNIEIMNTPVSVKGRK